MWPRLLNQNFVQIANSFKNPVTKEVFIFRHVLVVLFLSKIIVKSKSIPDPTVSLNLLKIVICQTLLLFKRFSSKYHLIHEMFKNYWISIQSSASWPLLICVSINHSHVKYFSQILQSFWKLVKNNDSPLNTMWTEHREP